MDDGATTISHGAVITDPEEVIAAAGNRASALFDLLTLALKGVTESEAENTGDSHHYP